MSAERNGNGDMTGTGISFLLADAADGVDIGAAPVQAVMRGGRRRRARRLAVTAATALVLAGSTGALAVTSLPHGGHEARRTNVAERPSSPEARHVYQPQTTELSRGMYKGKPWSVIIQVWGAPRDISEAYAQFEAMSEWRVSAVADKPARMVGKSSYVVTFQYDTDNDDYASRHISRLIMFDTLREPRDMSGTDMLSAIIPVLEAGDGLHDKRLMVGEVAKSAREVTCYWKDGRTAVAKRGPVNYRNNLPDPAIVAADGYPASNWFVCMAPSGTTVLKAEVTK